MSLNRELVRDLIDYNPETGAFVWRKPRRGVRHGAVAGCLDREGYRIIIICGKRMYAHRLAWFYTYGVLPSLLDHIDLNKDNNRIANLRVATSVQNRVNRQHIRKNATGFKGVRQVRSGLFVATIAHTHIGTFSTVEEATAAYRIAEKTKYGDFASFHGRLDPQPIKPGA